LSRCRESGNLEIIYREGMMQYFSTLMLNLGFENLKKAALQGHHEAKYVYVMLLMANCNDDEEGRKLGFDLFGELKNSTCISILGCRKRLKSFIQSMWVKNVMAAQNQGLSLCSSNTCHNPKAEKVVKKHSTWFTDEFDHDGVGVCKYCDGNHELSLFCKMF
jgi:TPR repeat protein